MSQNTSIEWTDCTWNPVRGCSRVSEGCRYCYAERDAARKSTNPKLPGFKGFSGFHIVGDHKEARWTGKVELIESKLEEPLHWRKPRRVFVNSMSDLFHNLLSIHQIVRVFETMRDADWHTYQILTKRAERLPEIMPEVWRRIGARSPLDHIWFGVSVEDQTTADERIPRLLETPAAVRFVSYEPALGPVDFERIRRDYFSVYVATTYLNQIIYGGESGPQARPNDIAWARSTRDQCKAAGTAFFMKQYGSVPVDSGWGGIAEPPLGKQVIALKDRKGGDMQEWPEDLRIREFPEIARAGARAAANRREK